MVKLDTVVREFMIESLGAEQIDNRYGRLLQIAMSGLKDLNLDMPGRTKFVTLEINENDTATLPNDYIDYVRIGLCRDGQILALGLNDNMCPPERDECGNVEICQPGYTSVPVTTEGLGLPFYDPAYYGKYYGAGGGNNSLGYYKVWDKEGFVAFQRLHNSYDHVIMEYIGSLDEWEGEHLVHPYDVEAVKAWMWWKWVQRNRTHNNYDKEEAKRTYGVEKRRSVSRHGRLSMNELMQAVRSGYKSSPKI